MKSSLRSITPQPAPIPTPVAQYVRMSDEGQEFSIANQKTAIADYAKRHNFVIVRTYEDAGKSGLVLRCRAGLRELIQDVISGKPEYMAILVYDVSRWGRFQNNDEAAHYEFLCTSSGIPLHYCAEQFENNSSPSSSLLKALKRSMAAEFSRELGEKVYRGKVRLVKLGFWVGGMAGFGFRRLMISATGKPKQTMKFGEQKSLITDRVVLIHGPQREVECVRKMFQLALHGKRGCAAIARDLNSQGYRCWGNPWQDTTVRNILTNPKYAGHNVWGRTSAKLGGRIIHTKATSWIIQPNTFPSIVDQQTFDQVQAKLPTRADQLWTAEEILNCLRRLLARKGRLSETLIMEARGTPSIGTIHKHLGSYAEIYEKVGFKYSPLDIFKGGQTASSVRLRRSIANQLKDTFPGSVTISHLNGGSRSILRIDDRFDVSLLLCRRKRRNGGRLHWVVQPNEAERDLVTLLCTMNPTHDGVCGFYLFPRIDHKSHRSYNNDPWLKTGIHLTNLSRFYDAANEIYRTRKLYSLAS